MVFSKTGMNKVFCALLFLIVACVPVSEVSTEPVAVAESPEPVAVEESPVPIVAEPVAEVLEPVAVPVEPLQKSRVIVEQSEESNDCLKLGCPFDAAVVADLVSDLFYDCSCPKAKWIKPEDALCFESAEYAIERGYRKAESC